MSNDKRKESPITITVITKDLKSYTFREVVAYCIDSEVGHEFFVDPAHAERVKKRPKK